MDVPNTFCILSKDNRVALTYAYLRPNFRHESSFTAKNMDDFGHLDGTFEGSGRTFPYPRSGFTFVRYRSAQCTDLGWWIGNRPRHSAERFQIAIVLCTGNMLHRRQCIGRCVNHAITLKVDSPLRNQTGVGMYEVGNQFGSIPADSMIGRQRAISFPTKESNSEGELATILIP